MTALTGTPAALVTPPAYLECPPWCAHGHDADVGGPGLWIRNHRRTGGYVDLTGYPEGFAMVWVAVVDSWRPGTSTGWKRDRPIVLISPARGTQVIQVWSVPSLRPILKAGPLLMPGLLELIIEAAQFCEIKIPQEYAG
jgi:hypothetical protein